MFLGVAFVVQGEQAVKDLTPGGFGDCVADALFGLVEAVAEVEVGPAVRGGDGVVHLDVERAEGGDVCGDFVRRVEAVVGSGESLTRATMISGGGLRSARRSFERRNAWKWKRLEAVGGRIDWINSHC